MPIPTYNLSVIGGVATARAHNDEVNRVLWEMWNTFLLGPLPPEETEALLQSLRLIRDAAVTARDIAVGEAAKLSDLTDIDLVSADARKRFVVNGAGNGFTLADRPISFAVAYSQSNFAGKSAGTPWRTPPPDNLFVWNGGNWNGDIVPPLGTGFVKASTLDPQIPTAYAAELARERPDTDFYLVIIARGGTGVRALAGLRYRFRTATSGFPASGDIRLGPSNGQVVYNETDLTGYTRFVGDTDLGVNTFYPARIETANDGGASWIEFTPTTMTDGGDWRSQPIAVTGMGGSWPPADGTGVIVYPTEPRMREVMLSNLNAALTAAGLTGSRRRIDRLLIWPTESDLNYHVAYEDRDFDFILQFLAAYITADTDVLVTLPYPYGAGIAPTRGNWWSAIRRIVARDSDARTLISLENSGAEHWGDTNNIHVVDGGRETVGYLMRRSEAKGGTTNPVALSGSYTPVFTPVANVAASTISEALWFRVGDMVTVAGIANISATATGAATEVRISLPVPSDIVGAAELSGQAAANTPADHVAQINGHPASDTASMTYTARALTGSQWAYRFTYRIRAVNT